VLADAAPPPVDTSLSRPGVADPGVGRQSKRRRQTMNKKSGERMSLGTWVIVASLACATAFALAEETPGSTPVEQLPAAIREQAAQVFAAGLKCYIWAGPANSITAEDRTIMSGMPSFTTISPGLFYVLASPANDNLKFRPGFRFLVKEGDTEKVESGIGMTKASSDTASSKESRAFYPLFSNGALLRGRATVEAYLVDQTDARTPISNIVRIEVDLDQAAKNQPK